MSSPGIKPVPIWLLDEPTTGLHFDDIRQLLGVLQRLVEKGNTVLVVEHKPETIEIADHVVDLGPGAGTAGGERAILTVGETAFAARPGVAPRAGFTVASISMT